MDSIETIDIDAMADAWVLFRIDLLTARSYNVVCPINDHEILVMGGDRDLEDETEYLSDAILMNT